MRGTACFVKRNRCFNVYVENLLEFELILDSIEEKILFRTLFPKSAKEKKSKQSKQSIVYVEELSHRRIDRCVRHQNIQTAETLDGLI